MKILTVRKMFGNGTTYEYSKVISGNKKTNYTPPAPGSFEEKHEKYRQKVKNSRSRAATRAMSSDFEYHTVFTTTDREISHNPELFIRLVTSILNNQDVKYFLTLELNHPRSIWQYDDWENDYNEGIKADNVINRYGCFNRICLAPLSENEGFHIHILTDRKVDFTEWIENFGGDPKNLYSEIFYHNQLDNVKYILKYFYYTKSVLPDNFHIYRSNIKRIKHGIVISEKDLDTGIIDILYSSEKEKEIKEERRLKRKYYSNLNHNFCELNINLFKYIKENHSFWNVLNRQNVLLFSFYDLLPHKKVTSSDVLFFDFNSFITEKVVETKKAYLKSSIKRQDSKIKDFVSDRKRYARLILQEKSSKYIEFSFEKSNTERQALSVPFSWENWLLKYVVFLRTIPKNS